MSDKNIDIEAVFPTSEDSFGGTDCSELTSIATEFKDILKNITDMAEEFEAQSSSVNIKEEDDIKEEDVTAKEENFFEDTNIEGAVWESNADNDVEMSATGEENALQEESDELTPAKETYKLFVRNLPPGILSSELLKLFQPYGKVIECEVFVKNYAFVHMESKECGLKAIEELDNKVIKGVQINVQEARNKTIKMKHPIGSYGHQKVSTFKLWLSNLPAQNNHQSIIPMIEPYGRVVEVQTINRTSAFVHIENEECGRKAISGLNGKLMEGNGDKALVVSESTEPGGPTIPVMKLLITNVSEKVSASQLRDLFTKYGMVIESKITPHAQNEERKAIVYLEAIGDIRTALKEMNGYVIEEQVLKVEPLSEAEEKKLEGSLKYKALDPGFGKSKAKPPPLMQTPTTRDFRGNRGRPDRSVCLRPLFADHQKQWRLIPMPSAYEGLSYPPYDNYRKPMHLVSPPSRRGRGMGPNFPPRRVHRDESEFYTDNYDDFYEPPFQNQQDMESQRNNWLARNQSYQNSQLMDSPMCDQDYSPLIKKARPKLGQLHQSFHQQNQPTPLMDLPFGEDSVASRNNFGNESFSSFRRPAPLNLPLGEKQYFSNFKKVNKSKLASPGNPNIPSLMETMNKPQSSGFQQYGKQQSNDSMAFSQDSFSLPGFYANDQIQGPNSNYWTPAANEGDKNKFSFSNMMHNYSTNQNNQQSNMYSTAPSSSNFRQNNPHLQQQQPPHFPDGVDPNDYPSLKPGAKVYINGKGKVMVRGNRGGTKTKRPRKPVMAIEMPSRANMNKPKGLMGLNKHKKGLGRQKLDQQQKIEYSTWLEQKPWLHQAIPGTIKRL